MGDERAETQQLVHTRGWCSRSGGPGLSVEGEPELHDASVTTSSVDTTAHAAINIGPARFPLLPSGGSRRRWAPAAAQTARVSAGLAPGPGSGPPPPPPPLPLPARRLLSSRGHGVALGPPRRVSASASAALVPGSRCPRSSRSAQAGAALREAEGGGFGQRAAEAGGGGGAAEALRRARRRPLLLRPGRSARAGRPRRRRAPGAGAARRALRGSRRELRPRSGGGQSRGAPASGRQEPPPPGAGHQPGSPSPPAVPAAPQPARTWARGAARRAAGPAKFASPLGAEPRARPGRAAPGGTESPRTGRRGGGAKRGGSAPPDAGCKVREKKTSALGRFGPLRSPRPPNPAPLKEAPQPRPPPRSLPARPRGPGARIGGDCVRAEHPTRGRGGGGGRATWPPEEVSRSCRFIPETSPRPGRIAEAALRGRSRSWGAQGVGAPRPRAASPPSPCSPLAFPARHRGSDLD
ncbi:translation initiation factor IF-2-like [Budorcas taxicolor]|uniref:translation initiation factor IF-2-like n=1 Tax=Budorcas taxicolor TaxID=37181 RepID=UPI0022833974|nr:translation initiation factor IF-2-like [Budorcas taxicolor]